MKILIVDDSEDLCSAIERMLQNNGYETHTAHDGKKGLRMALSNEYDVILLDIMMPQMNGYRVLESLRREGRTTPVILITAKNEICDRIDGLERGADDFIQKPFNFDELLARIRALARRSSICDYDSKKIAYADIILNSDTRKLSRGELQITLSPLEYSVIKYLIKNSSVVVPTDKIAESCTQSEDSMNLIKDCIDRLRRKLIYICSKIQIIFIKGVGYKLCF